MTNATPPVHEAMLDGATLDALVADVLAHAELLDVMTKGGPSAYAAFGPRELTAAVDALRAGRVRAVQLRYRHGGDEWRDTLVLAPTGVRLVRIQTPSLGGTS